MKPWYRILLVAVVATIVQLILPWWSAVIAACLVEVIFGSRKFLSFFVGFYGVAVPWMVISLVIDIQNNSILSDRVMTMFTLPTWPLLAIIVTGLVGGVAGGLGSWSGGHIHSLFSNGSEE